MVGLQRPQAEPGANEDNEEDSKMVCVAINDDFVLKQDICVMCGAIGNIKFLILPWKRLVMYMLYSVKMIGISTSVEKKLISCQ